MRAKRTSGAIMISLVIHIVFILIAALYFVAQTQTFKDILGYHVYSIVPPKPPQVRNPIVKPLVKPHYSSVETKITVEVAPQARLTNINAKDTDYYLQLTEELHFSNPPRKKDTRRILNAPIHPNVPRVVNPNVHKLEVATSANYPVSTSPNTLLVGSPTAQLPSAVPARIGRGVAGSVVQVKIMIQRPPGLSMIEHVGVERDALDKLTRTTQLGNIEIPPPPKREPSGIVVGRGRDIRGFLRFGRIRHTLSDWWADSSSLNALTKWLNEKTKIRTDMNVEGGSFKLTDANLQKTPIAFMTGHDPSLVRSRNLLGRQYGGGKMDSRFTEAEAAGLRKYLVEKGGFLVFDDCGVNAPAQAMVRLFIAQMRYVMPEYQIERIDNGHEIYNNFYEMGGPPVGFDIFWWGTRPPRRNYLEGFSVGEKLSVLVVRRDYMCAMEAVSLPTRSVHYSPGVYRFMTNVVVYALTHGAISNYSGYVPEDALAKKELPTRAPQAANIRVTE